MTIKEAIIKSLEDLIIPVYNLEVFNHINEKKYYTFLKGKTPASTVSALLGDFIRNGDSRVKRIKKSNGIYYYYLTKNENQIDINLLNAGNEESFDNENSKMISKGYDEIDLHIILSSYLKNSATYSKTIFHQQSNGSDNNQIWTHPDIVGIKFLNLQSRASQNLLKTINRIDTFKITSYELKKEINSDSDLKRAYFQAVSNSSWANYGFLVAFDFNDSLFEEMARLNQSFGIGIIKLNSNPYESKILFPSTYRELDFKTIDKLCKMNPEFERFIEQTEKLLTANEKYVIGAERELEEFCDKFFKSDSEAEQYCIKKSIPIEK